MKQNFLELPLGPASLDHLGLNPGEIIRLAWGQKTVRVRLAQDGEEAPISTLYINGRLARAMGVPEGIRLNLQKKGKVWHLGPLVGILIARYCKERGSFGAQDNFFRGLLASLGRLNGAGFVFCPRDINSERKSIYGYYLRGKADKGWKRMYFPFPDVCYNRYIDDGSGPGSYQTIPRLARHGVKTFNPFIGDKWAVHRLLMSHQEVAGHLPETRLLDSDQVLLTMLKKHQEVYLKPPGGSKGRGIMKVSRKKGTYLLKTATRNSFWYRSAREVVSKSKAKMNCSRPIIQQSIRALGNEQHYDFRALVQKDRFNQWGLTGIAARIGANGQITTNLHAGGKAQEAYIALVHRGFSREQIDFITKSLEELALRIAEIIDQKTRTRLLGELGLDFLVDQEGKVWFLEANPKPGRRAFRDISPDLRRIAVSRPMEYACFLAGF